MVLPEGEPQKPTEEELHRAFLSLVDDVRAIRLILCNLLGKQTDDPRYRSGDVYRNRG